MDRTPILEQWLAQAMRQRREAETAAMIEAWDAVTERQQRREQALIARNAVAQRRAFWNMKQENGNG